MSEILPPQIEHGAGFERTRLPQFTIFLENRVGRLTALLRALEGGLRSSVHRVNWEQAYLTIDGPQRAQAKLIIDGMAVRLAEGTVALVLLAWLRLVIGGRPLAGPDGAWISYLLLVASVAWLGLAGALGAQAGGRSLRRASLATAAAAPLPDT